MKTKIGLTAAGTFLLAGALLPGQTPVRPVSVPAPTTRPAFRLERFIPPDTQQACGLSKLTPEERDRLATAIAAAILLDPSCDSARGYLYHLGYKPAAVIGSQSMKPNDFALEGPYHLVQDSEGQTWACSLLKDIPEGECWAVSGISGPRSIAGAFGEARVEAAYRYPPIRINHR